MELPSSVSVVNYKDKEIYLLGTAHVSKKSVDEVTEVVENVKPDSICVELCKSRLESIQNKDNWKKMDIFKILKEKKVPFLMAQLLMSSFYKKLGEKLEVTPGAEMIQGVKEAEKMNAELVLADRNIEVTLRRVWGGLSLFQRLNFVATILASMFSKEEDIDEATIESLKEKDHLEDAMEEFAEQFPGIREPLINERDIYLSEKIKNAPGKKIVAVVGAAHVNGIISHLEENHNLEEIEVIPKELPIIKIIGWIIPLLIIGLIAYGFTKSSEIGTSSIMIWILVNGIFSAIGAIIATANPVTVITSFIAAPITSLNPTIGAGIVAGIVQAFMKKPTVEDLETVSDAMENFSSFRKNNFTRVLLVVILVSLGSSIGTFVAGFKIFSNITAKPTITQPSLQELHESIKDSSFIIEGKKENEK